MSANFKPADGDKKPGLKALQPTSYVQLERALLTLEESTVLPTLSGKEALHLRHRYSENEAVCR